MNTHTTRLPYPRLSPLVWGILATLVGAISIAVLMISAQASGAGAVPVELQETGTAAAIAAPVPRGYRCDECGVIESMRAIETRDAKSVTRKRGAGEGAPSRNYEITIRLQNGTMRVIRDANAAQWRHGEPVTIIAGAD